MNSVTAEDLSVRMGIELDLGTLRSRAALLMLPSTMNWLPENHLIFLLLDPASALDRCQTHDYCRQ